MKFKFSIILLLGLLLPVVAFGAWGDPLTMNQDRNLRAAALNLPPIAGTWYYADMKSGKESNGGMRPEDAVCSLQTALNKCVSGRGDGVALMADSTAYSFTVSRPCTLNKMGVTVFGVSNGNPYFNRARIKTLGTASPATSIHEVLVVIKENCQLINLFASNEDSAGHGCLKVATNRFFAKNCHFNSGVVANTAGGSDTLVRSPVVVSSASEVRFDDCYLGSNSTDLDPDGIQGVLFLTGAQGQNEFNRCTFLAQTDTGTQCMIKLGAATTLNGWIAFNACKFRAWVESTVPTIASLVNGTAQNNPGLLFDKDCEYVGYAALDTLDAQSFQAGKSSDSLGVYSPR